MPSMAMQQQADVTVVAADWSLVPRWVGSGEEFRLLFLSSGERDATENQIGPYNSFIQGLAAQGHADIQAYSAGFRAVGCTFNVDARDNTGTTYTNTDKGVPIYWLNRFLVADDYEDFYDGSWDNEPSLRDESGDRNTAQSDNQPFTGCLDDGTGVTDGTFRTLGAASGSVRIGGLNTVDVGPINGESNSASTNLRPMYGLSEVFRVESNDAALSGLELKDDDGAAVTLSPAFALGTRNYTASVAHDVVEVTIIPTVNESNATYEIQDGSGTALVDADANEDDFQVEVAKGANSIKVVVTAEDALTSRTYTVAFTRALGVPLDWSLLPSGLSPGDQFRLVFLSSMKRNGSSSNIAGYNTFIQNRAAAGHTDIQAYSSGFRVVGCTEAVHARDNTETTYTGADKGVPIYWLNGAKAADDYQDFYDGSWDEEAINKNELGANGPNTVLTAQLPLHRLRPRRHGGFLQWFLGPRQRKRRPCRPARQLRRWPRPPQQRLRNRLEQHPPHVRALRGFRGALRRRDAERSGAQRRWRRRGHADPGVCLGEDGLRGVSGVRRGRDHNHPDGERKPRDVRDPGRERHGAGGRGRERG